MGCRLLRRFLIVLVALVASVAGVLLTSGAAFAADTTPTAEEPTTPLATGVLIVSVTAVAVLIAIAVVGNRKTLARRTRRVIRRLARRLSRS
jgi:TRAP-type C4-dicarboxylate transport system permease small subunit